MYVQRASTRTFEKQACQGFYHIPSAKPNVGPKRGAGSDDPTPVGANVSEVDQHFIVAQVGCDQNEDLPGQAIDGKLRVYPATEF